METFLTMDELAKYMKVSTRTIMRWMDSGLPYNRYGRIIRFDKDESLAWFKAQKNGGE